MTLHRAQAIKAIWDRMQEDEPDISTERLMEMTAQEAGCDNAEVGEALFVVRDEMERVRKVVIDKQRREWEKA